MNTLDAGAIDVTSTKADRRRELLSEIEHHILRHGFVGLTVADIAAELRCSRRTVYELAESRDDLVCVVVDRFFRRTGRDAENALREPETYEEKAQAYLASTELSRASAQFKRDLVRWPPARAILDRHAAAALNRLEGLVEAGTEAGEFLPQTNARLVALMCQGTLDYLADLSTLNETGLAYPEAMHLVYDTIFRGIRS